MVWINAEFSCQKLRGCRLFFRTKVLACNDVGMGDFYKVLELKSESGLPHIKAALYSGASQGS